MEIGETGRTRSCRHLNFSPLPGQPPCARWWARRGMRFGLVKHQPNRSGRRLMRIGVSRGRTASDALASMQVDVDAGTVRFPRHCPDANPTFAAYGLKRMQWIENPAALGLRLVGLAHEVCPMVIRHEGWCLHPDGYWNGAVAGVVYRVSGKDGCARYLVGYADPWNCDKTGRGSALLCLDPMVGDHVDAEWEFDPVLREAARQAGRDMRESAACYTAALRAVRAVFCNRHRMGMGDARLIMAVQIAHLRSLLDRLRPARRTFETALSTERDWDHADNHGWRNGYADG